MLVNFSHNSRCSTMEALDNLHAVHLQSLSGEEQMDYLLSCQDYLKEEDVSGWKRQFAPDTLIEKTSQEPVMKRRRCSPDAVFWTPHPPCTRCKSLEILEDTMGGSVVCTACGLVQVRQLLGANSANMSYEQLKNGNRKIVHRYSRVAYFRSFLLGLQGKTYPAISVEELSSLQAVCVGKNVDAETVKHGLKRLKLATRFRRHRYTLARMINPEFKPVSMSAGEFFHFLKLFRTIECHWQHGLKRKLRGRLVFFSYPYVFYQLCYHLGTMHLTGAHHLLQDVTLLNKLHYAYGCCAKKAQLNCVLDVYR
jgi:hypothetical protein